MSQFSVMSSVYVNVLDCPLIFTFFNNVALSSSCPVQNSKLSYRGRHIVVLTTAPETFQAAKLHVIGERAAQRLATKIEEQWIKPVGLYVTQIKSKMYQQGNQPSPTSGSS